MENLLVTNDYASLNEAEDIMVVYDETTDLVWIKTPQPLCGFVDLGLPSGLKWATCNLGANAPEDFGLYFQWGDTLGYTIDDVNKGLKQFTFNDYKHISGGTFFTKYNTNSLSGTVDNKLVLELVDDAAYKNDNTCRMPTKAEIEELAANITYTWETLNVVKGGRFTSNINVNSFFVPAAAYISNGKYAYNGIGTFGYIESSSLYETYPRNQWHYIFDSSDAYMRNGIRNEGYPIRPVRFK